MAMEMPFSKYGTTIQRCRILPTQFVTAVPAAENRAAVLAEANPVKQKQ